MIKILNDSTLESKVNLLRNKYTPSFMLRQILEDIACLSIPSLIDDDVPSYKNTCKFGYF